MSRVKESENVLCADVIERETCANEQRRGAYSYSINQRDAQRTDQNSFDDAGRKILPRAVFRTADIQQAEMNFEMNRKSAGRRMASAAGIAMIPVIPTTEEFKIWR